MLIDVRTYEVRPGTLKAHLDLYAEYHKASIWGRRWLI